MSIIAQTSTVFNLMDMVTLQWIVPTRYHHQAHLPIIRDRITTQGITTDLLLDTVTGTGISIAGQDHSHTLTDITVIVMITHTEVTQDHITVPTIETIHDIATPALIIIAMTHHTRDDSQIEVPQLIPEIAASPDHVTL